MTLPTKKFRFCSNTKIETHNGEDVVIEEVDDEVSVRTPVKGRKRQKKISTMDTSDVKSFSSARYDVTERGILDDISSSRVSVGENTAETSNSAELDSMAPLTFLMVTFMGCVTATLFEFFWLSFLNRYLT